MGKEKIVWFIEMFGQFIGLRSLRNLSGQENLNLVNPFILNNFYLVQLKLTISDCFIIMNVFAP